MEVKIHTAEEIRQIAAAEARRLFDEMSAGLDASGVRRPFVNAAAACEYLNVSETKLRRMCRAGAVPYHSVDGSYRFDLDELHEATRARPKLKKVS